MVNRQRATASSEHHRHSCAQKLKPSKACSGPLCLAFWCWAVYLGRSTPFSTHHFGRCASDETTMNAANKPTSSNPPSAVILPPQRWHHPALSAAQCRHENTLLSPHNRPNPANISYFHLMWPNPSTHHFRPDPSTHRRPACLAAVCFVPS